jgi:dTDP-4-amino-4,6-dideoxygalactose transaminase
VPLYFPIIVDDRSALQKHLVDNAIYAPIVWPKDEQQPIQCEGAEYLYNHLLCIPIDQRYNQDDMRRIAKVIDNFYK